MKTQQRKFKETDRDYITRSVLFSFLNGSKEIQRINKDSYMQAHNQTINKVIDRCECEVVCDEQDPDLIYGFIIYENLKNFDVIHYVLVRKDFRHLGLAKQMINSIVKTKSCAISHLTDEFRPARLKKYWDKVIYDPYLRASK